MAAVRWRPCFWLGTGIRSTSRFTRRRCLNARAEDWFIRERLFETSVNVAGWSSKSTGTRPNWNRPSMSVPSNLSASQERYKALFDLVADSVFMIDAEGIVVASISGRNRRWVMPRSAWSGRNSAGGVVGPS